MGLAVSREAIRFQNNPVPVNPRCIDVAGVCLTPIGPDCQIVFPVRGDCGLSLSSRGCADCNSSRIHYCAVAPDSGTVNVREGETTVAAVCPDDQVKIG